MKFLNIYCENRKAEVYISLDKIILIKKLDDEGACLIELEGPNTEPVKAAMLSEDLIRKINGEDRMGIGFRRSI
ncbi:MAG: hypothetical protein EON98_09170 [Chitinophagaceae bacterium]|nr:MAG: hypothetical protein EON98_09170 [Chitinophagaceae bacterium]